MKVKLHLKLSVEQNASKYFEEAKKARKKLVGVKSTLEDFTKRHDEQSLVKVDKTSSIKKLDHKKLWFEKFRWFVTSEGFLVIGARDATTNEIIIKKHTVKDDIVLHTDMAGSPFVVIKKDTSDVKKYFKISSEKEIGEQSIQEAATFTFSHSKAWKAGHGSTKVFWVSPDQVTKEANSGEFLPKGAFMIRGKTTYVEPGIEYGVGILNEFIMGGPISAVKARDSEALILIQGSEKASVIAKAIRANIQKIHELDVTIDNIVQVIPSSGCQLKKERRR